MKKELLVKITSCLICLLVMVSVSPAQRKKPPIKQKPKPLIFAVLNDGKTIEPISFIEKGQLAPAVGGDSEDKDLANFHSIYYKPKTMYRLIFGGANVGNVSVVSSDLKSDCSANMASVLTSTKRAKLGGFVMGLATNFVTTSDGSGVRRLPTPAERSEIEGLVRAEFIEQGVAGNLVRNLKYHNLTALDVEGDGKSELVGSFWVETSATERGLLFFVADRSKGDQYSFGFSEFARIKQDEVMSGDIKDLDGGVYHQLLLDILDYNNDGVAEIFTYTQSFEGAGFNAYQRKDGTWEKVFEVSNYHCGY